LIAHYRTAGPQPATTCRGEVPTTRRPQGSCYSGEYGPAVRGVSETTKGQG
jgi:hypothetical protein